MKFNDIKIGQEFFDPFSGEYFRKIDMVTGIMLTGGDFFTQRYAHFHLDEEVELNGKNLVCVPNKNN